MPDGASTNECPGCGHFLASRDGKHKANGVEEQQCECLQGARSYRSCIKIFFRT